MRWNKSVTKDIDDTRAHQKLMCVNHESQIETEHVYNFGRERVFIL